MNLREQFEKESNASWHGIGEEGDFNPDYVEWLEQRNKEQVGVLEMCYKDYKETEDAAYNVGAEMWESDKEILTAIEKQLNK